MAAASVGLVALPASATDTLPEPIDVHISVGEGITLSVLHADAYLQGVPGEMADNDDDPASYNVLTNNASGYQVTVQALDDKLLPPDPDSNPDSIPISALKVYDGHGYQSLSKTAAVTVWDQESRSADLGDVHDAEFMMEIPVVSDATYSVTLEYIASTN